MMYEEAIYRVFGSEPIPQDVAVKRSNLVDSLICAKNALANGDAVTGKMRPEDITAWLDLDDLQEKILCGSACASTRVKA